MSQTTLSPNHSLPAPQIGATTVGLGASALLGAWLFAMHGIEQGLFFLIGIGLGVSLYHARFGFTSAFRQLMAVGQGTTLRAHLLMLTVACILFAPLLAYGSTLFGGDLQGYVFPISLGVAVGGFMFGVGMQLGGSCASGSLYTVGSGQSSIVITLAGFIVGSVWAAHDFAFWMQPSLQWRTVSLADTNWGYPGAILMQLGVFAVIAAATYAIEKRLRPPRRQAPPHAHGWARILRGAWPLWAGAIALAVLNALTLWTSGKPWGITSAFALWGSKAVAATGADVGQWFYWSELHAGVLDKPVLADRTSVMDFGIILGAMTAASIGGRFSIVSHIPWRTVIARLIGGVLMGYGARIAFGCNIGAYFGGIASFSLHGWLWGVVALGGTVLGVKLRPLFGLGVPKRSDGVC